jgi:hypothetical protein
MQNATKNEPKCFLLLLFSVAHVTEFWANAGVFTTKVISLCLDHYFIPKLVAVTVRPAPVATVTL